MNTHRHAQRAVAFLLVSLFAFLSIGGDGCWEYKAPTATYDCCAGSDVHWSCTVQVQIQAVMDQPSVKCFQPDAQCAGTEAQAQKNVTNLATIYYSRGNVEDGLLAVDVQTVSCTRLAACIQKTSPLDEPLDTPGACATVVTVDAGTSSCVVNDDACLADNDCCSGVCSELGACEACRAMAEGCTTNTECCSGVCSLNACGG